MGAGSLVGGLEDSGGEIDDVGEPRGRGPAGREDRAENAYTEPHGYRSTIPYLPISGNEAFHMSRTHLLVNAEIPHHQRCLLKQTEQ